MRPGGVQALERLLLERNPLSEILAKRDPRADPRSVQEGSSDTATAANADLQGAMKLVPCTRARMWHGPDLWEGSVLSALGQFSDQLLGGSNGCFGLVIRAEE